MPKEDISRHPGGRDVNANQVVGVRIPAKYGFRLTGQWFFRISPDAVVDERIRVPAITLLIVAIERPEAYIGETAKRSLFLFRAMKPGWMCCLVSGPFWNISGKPMAKCKRTGTEG